MGRMPTAGERLHQEHAGECARGWPAADACGTGLHHSLRLARPKQGGAAGNRSSDVSAPDGPCQSVVGPHLDQELGGQGLLWSIFGPNGPVMIAQEGGLPPQRSGRSWASARLLR